MATIIVRGTMREWDHERPERMAWAYAAIHKRRRRKKDRR